MFLEKIVPRLRIAAGSLSLVTALAACSLAEPRIEAPPVSAVTTDAGATIARADSDADVATQLALASASLGRALPGETVGYYLDVQTAKLRTLQQQDMQIRRASDHIQLVLPGTGSFDTDSAMLTTAIQDTLDALAKLLREYDQSMVLIAGHSDNLGDPGYNLQLSRERARSVGLYLHSQGVETQRIVIRGFGDSRPVSDNATAAGRAANRRIELELWPLTAPVQKTGTS